jgi:ABC-2 type transport system permease protein
MIRFLLEKEFRQIRRNAFLPRIIVMMPLAMMFVFTWAANQEIRNMKLAVVDNNHTVVSQRMVNKITSSGYFTLTSTPPSWPLALEEMEAGRADIIMEISPDSRVSISVNGVNGMKAGLGSRYLSSIIADFNAEMSAGNFTPTATTPSAAEPGVAQTYQQTYQLAPYYRFNPALDYKIFMIPGLMVMLITMFCGFLPSLNVVSEKEAGTIEQLNVTPVRRIDFVLGKLIPNWIIGFVALAFCMTVAALVYGLTPADGVAGVATIAVFTILYMLVVSGMGLIISNYSATMQQAMFVMFFFMMIMMLMSGLFTPVRSMPQWAQCVATINPSKYFVEVMRLVYLRGGGFAQLWPQFLALCAFALVFDGWAISSYKKQN